MKALDLNALEQPVLELTFKDDDRTTVRLTYPTEKLVERFTSASASLNTVSRSKNPTQIKKIYELLADIVNCNDDGLVVTAEELRDKYRVNFLSLTFIFKAYLEFLHELNDVKN